LAKPDIAALGASTFVIPSSIASIFKPFLDKHIELLECKLEGESWFALNVIGYDDVLDNELTIINMRNGKPSRTNRFKRMVFNKKSIINTTLFRAKNVGIRYFTTDAKNSIYSLSKENGWQGLYFEEVELTE
jgi:hypothetical protein